MKKNPDKDSRTKKVKSGRWGVGKRWQAVWTEAGKPVTEMFDSQDAAEAFVAKAVTKQDEGLWITKDKRKITLGDVWELFIATKAGTSDSTRADYSSAWKTHFKHDWADRSCATIKRAEIVIWLDGLTTTKGLLDDDEPRPLSGSARRLVGLTLKGVLDTAVKEGIILTNPMRARDLPKQSTAERRYLTIPGPDRLVAAAPTKYAKRAVIVLYRTGVRLGEAFGFKVGDFSPTRGRLRVQRDVDALGRPDTTKTDRHRDVPAGGDLTMDLEDWTEGPGREEWLLPANEDGHVGPPPAGGESGPRCATPRASRIPSPPTSSATQQRA